jgi:hypothetical protein
MNELTPFFTLAVHYWERYAWMLLLVFYFCMWGLAGKRGFDLNAQKPLQATGLEYAGNFLSFGVSHFSLLPFSLPSTPLVNPWMGKQQLIWDCLKIRVSSFPHQLDGHLSLRISTVDYQLRSSLGKCFSSLGWD